MHNVYETHYVQDQENDGDPSKRRSLHHRRDYHLGVNVESDFRRHHLYKKPSGRIDENPSNAASFTLESFYRKEFKTKFDTQISTCTEVHDNSKETTGLLIDTLHPEEKEAPLESFRDLSEYFPRDQRPDPEALMSEMEILRCHLTGKRDRIKDISDAARVAEEKNQCFLWLTRLTARLLLHQ